MSEKVAKVKEKLSMRILFGVCGILWDPMATYDKIYKNFGFGDGIFSWNRWCRRQQQKEAK